MERKIHKRLRTKKKGTKKGSKSLQTDWKNSAQHTSIRWCTASGTVRGEQTRDWRYNGQIPANLKTHILGHSLGTITLERVFPTNEPQNSLLYAEVNKERFSLLLGDDTIGSYRHWNYSEQWLHIIYMHRSTAFAISTPFAPFPIVGIANFYLINKLYSGKSNVNN